MSHLTARTKRALRTWVLQAEGHDEAGAARALMETVSALLTQSSAGEVVEVFAERIEWPAHLRHDQVGWHRRWADLMQALAAAHPDGFTHCA